MAAGLTAESRIVRWKRLAVILIASSCQRSPEAIPAAGFHRIRGEPVCRRCTIELREIAVLGSDSDPASPREDAAGQECMVARMRSGDFAVSGMVGGGSIWFYSPDGRLVRSSGRRGAGPGEFGSRLRLVVSPADTLYVVDDSNARVQVLTPAGEFVRAFPWRGRYRSFGLLAGGVLLFQRAVTGRDDPLFNVVASTGELVRRFGRATMDELDLENWIVSPATRGFWLASIWKYEMYRYASPDSPTSTVVRDVDWFPPGGKLADGVYNTVAPPPFLIHIREDRVRTALDVFAGPGSGLEAGPRAETVTRVVPSHLRHRDRSPGCFDIPSDRAHPLRRKTGPDLRHQPDVHRDRDRGGQHAVADSRAHAHGWELMVHRTSRGRTGKAVTVRRAQQAGLVFLIIVLAPCDRRVAASPLGADQIERIDSLARAVMRERSVPGLSIAIASRGELLLARGWGTANGSDPVTDKTVFDLGSIKKQITAAAVLRLVDRGAIDLNDPVEKWVQSIRVLGTPVRIRQMLEQVSGLPDVEDDTIRTLDFAPGSRWGYSNANFDRMDAVIEAVDGRPFPVFLEEELAGPLHLASLSNV